MVFNLLSNSPKQDDTKQKQQILAKINCKGEMLKVYNLRSNVRQRYLQTSFFIQQYREILASPVRQKVIKDERTEKEETKLSLFIKCHNCLYRKINIA